MYQSWMLDVDAHCTLCSVNKHGKEREVEIDGERESERERECTNKCNFILTD